MSFSPLIADLIHAFRSLPGVGPRTAQRMALYLLERNREAGVRLADSLKRSMAEIGNCKMCRTLCETDLCSICHSQKRDRTQLCIVETPMDVLAIEQSATYRGVYFVLMGHLSPLDGIGPKELKLDELEARLRGVEVKELILATNPTIEGEATAHYVTDLAKKYNKAVSRIAYGVPFGGELEYVDGQTLSHAFRQRKEI